MRCDAGLADRVTDEGAVRRRRVRKGEMRELAKPR